MANFTDVNKIKKQFKMRDLDLIKKELESKVRDYLETCCSEDEWLSEDIELDVSVNGVDFSATVSVNGYFSFEPFYESDKFGISHFMGNECNLDTFDYEIKYLWDDEIEEYIVEDYKPVEK